MRGSEYKRLTIIALLIWGGGLLISSFIPWEVVASGRDVFDEMQEIAEANPPSHSPRILLIGSSPVVLGLSASEIADRTGMPTVNLGAPAAVSFFPEYFSEAIDHIRPDDIVVVSDPNWMSRGQPMLAQGCVNALSMACIFWRARPLPHLLEFVKVVSGLWKDGSGIPRDALGDAVNAPSTNSSAHIPTLPFNGHFANAVSVDLQHVWDQVRNKGGCPVLVFGPVFVEPADLGKWRAEQSATEARVAKLGLTRSIITDGAISTDRSLFLDSYEHPSDKERELWTDRVAERLTSRSQSPCANNMAKAERPQDHS